MKEITTSWSLDYNIIKKVPSFTQTAACFFEILFWNIWHSLTLKTLKGLNVFSDLILFFFSYYISIWMKSSLIRDVHKTNLFGKRSSGFCLFRSLSVLCNQIDVLIRALNRTTLLACLNFIGVIILLLCVIFLYFFDSFDICFYIRNLAKAAYVVCLKSFISCRVEVINAVFYAQNWPAFLGLFHGKKLLVNLQLKDNINIAERIEIDFVVSFLKNILDWSFQDIFLRSWKIVNSFVKNHFYKKFKFKFCQKKNKILKFTHKDILLNESIIYI